jgi:hypothetical protein
MTEVLESVAIVIPAQHDSSCPFCAGAKPQLLGYHTKYGELKDEAVLGKNLESASDVTSDKEVGTVFPLPGGDQPHNGWVVKAGIFEDIPVEVRPTPHHLIPGNAAMAPSTLEEWTRQDKGKIKEDIGYNIDCAQNGIWLPHLPHIHWTRFMDTVKKIRFSAVFGTWGKLAQERREFIGYIVMGETWLQMHYTDHDDPYAHVDNDTTYDGEAEERCNLLGELIGFHWAPLCPESKDAADDKYFPPYGLVKRINLQSEYMRRRITGKPTYWQSWVSPLAQDYTSALLSGTVHLSTSFSVSRA